jgi:hypothetical protein
VAPEVLSPASPATDPVVAEALAAAKKRAAEIRAEAALLVETVEDRAHAAVAEAQAETAKHAEEVDRLKAELLRMRGQQ